MISFAGVELLLDNPSGEVQAWLDQFLPLDDLRIVSDWTYARLNLSEGLPLPNYSSPLKPQLNTWYRPTGASRWSFGLFLATTAMKDAVLSGIQSPGAEVQYAGVIGLGGVLIGTSPGATGGPLTYTIADTAYLLPPRPISAEINDAAALWILPIVDVRYFWQFVNTSFTPGSWATNLAQFEAALSIDTLTVDTVESEYVNADPRRLSVSGNAAVMLDAMAHSVGLRLVNVYGNTEQPHSVSNKFRLANWTTSRAILQRNLNRPNTGTLQAGSVTNAELNKAAIMPASVKVVFRKWANGIVWDGEFYTVTVTGSSIVGSSEPTNPQYIKSIKTTALADFTGAGSDPDNLTECEDLANQIATDFYNSLYWVQDSVYLGTQIWEESGFDDYIEYTASRRMPDGTYTTQTRVHTIPFNFGVEDMLHQFTDVHEYDDHVMGYLNADLSALGTAEMAVWEGDPLADTGRTLEVTEQYGSTMSSGDAVRAFKIGKLWIADSGGSGGSTTPNLTGVASAFKTQADGSGTFTTGLGSKTATIRAGCVLPGKTYDLVWIDDDHYEVVNPELTFVGKVAAIIQYGNFATVGVWAGTKASETTVGSTVSALVRDGLVLSGEFYKWQWTDLGWECSDPTLTFDGKTDASQSKGATGTISVYAGTPGSETDTTVNVTGVYNRFANLSTTKWVLVQYHKSSRGWQIAMGECG